MKSQSEATFEEISQLIAKFVEARDWHTAPTRGVAASISIEAAELLEHFQWSDKPVGSKEELAAELADVLIYCFRFAQNCDIDMAEAIKAKLAKNTLKYPVKNFKGKTAADQKSAWLTARQNHKKQGL